MFWGSRAGQVAGGRSPDDYSTDRDTGGPGSPDDYGTGVPGSPDDYAKIPAVPIAGLPFELRVLWLLPLRPGWHLPVLREDVPPGGRWDCAGHPGRPGTPGTDPFHTPGLPPGLCELREVHVCPGWRLRQLVLLNSLLPKPSLKRQRGAARLHKG